MTYFKNLADNARVWIFQSDRVLEASDQDTIRTKLDAFIPNWAAHGNALFGNYAILNNYHVVVALDEALAGASGCSIDSMTRVIKELEVELEIDFFQRMNVLLESDGQLELKPFLKISVEDKDKGYFDNTIQTLSELNSVWSKPATEGWLATRVK